MPCAIRSLFCSLLLVTAACGGESATPTCTPGTVGCSSVSPGPGTDGGGIGGATSCDRYLSCLLQATPQAYGAAIQLYGKDSACWTTPQQTVGCNQACDASFATISKSCECTATTCQLCKDSSGMYQEDELHRLDVTCTASVEPQGFNQATIEVGAGRSTKVVLRAFGGSNGNVIRTLAGTQSCGGVSTISVDEPGTGFGCSYAAMASVTPSSDGKYIHLEMTETRTCQGSSPYTCTYSGSLARY